MTRRWLPAALVLGLLAGPAQADGLRVTTVGGAWSLKAMDKLQVWANSPEASMVIDNRGQRAFLTLSATWDNCLAGSFLSTPEGLVVGTSRDGSPIGGSLSVGPSERQSWSLHPNVTGAYRFAIVSGTRAAGAQSTYGVISKDMATHGTTFAIHLGNATSGGNQRQLAVFREQLRSFAFPTYVLPGNHEVAAGGRKAFGQLFGALPLTFRVGPDRFIMLDNATGKLERKAEDWLYGVLGRVDDEKARHVFVFMHRPLVDVRPGLNEGMTDRPQVRRLLKTFAQHHVHSVFAGHLPMFARERRQGVTYVTTAGGGERPVVPKTHGGFHHWVRVDVDANGAVNMAPVRVAE